MTEATYFPGCSLHGTAREYDESFRAVAGLLGIDLVELEDWTCCGSTSAHSVDSALAAELPLRNLRLAGRHSRPMVIPCVACYSRFKAAEAMALSRPEGLTTPYEGGVPLRYGLDFFCDPKLLSALAAKIKNPLKGLKAACYYGCLAVRPDRLTGVKDYENPTHMERLLELLGASPVEWSYKTDCCGASLTLTRTDIVERLSGNIAAMAREAGAECLVTACSMCHANLDTRQPKGRGVLPVFYFTELMGLAMGHGQARGWLSRHITDPADLMKAKGLL